MLFVKVLLNLNNSNMVPIPPGNVGQRLLPSFIDEIARNDPSRIFYSINKTRDPADGFQDITSKAFAQAVDRCAWYLEETMGRGYGFPTLLYMGPQDVLYAILVRIHISDAFCYVMKQLVRKLCQRLFLSQKPPN